MIGFYLYRKWSGASKQSHSPWEKLALLFYISLDTKESAVILFIRIISRREVIIGKIFLCATSIYIIVKYTYLR